ncbi:NAD/NADP-dependent octopine/nopaline dehydrogenase family protein [Roseateles flavus]|uniref:2-dehydropantoate 2-reductase n=1 Tax=Roseateles flavus TaxID=3149041 RepID=A0ABV0GKX3_9BURK
MDFPVSIIGAGHCGCAFAADLLHRGSRVLLYSHPEHARNLRAIHEAGGLQSAIKIEGTFAPELSMDLEKAVQFSRYLIITVPAYGHDDIIEQLAPFDLSQHVVICVTGNFFSLAARRSLRAKALLETSSSPYASRVENALVRILGIKSRMTIAALAPDSIGPLRLEVAQLFSMPLTWLGNVIEVGLSCITGVIHPTPTLLNLGWIESTKGDFYFYRQGMSKSVATVMEQVDQERLQVAQAFGLDLPATIDVMNDFYGGSYADLATFAAHSIEHNMNKVAPATLEHRFISQDVPYVLVPWYELGRKAGIECRTIRSVIHLASLAKGTDYLRTGRTLRKLGLHLLEKEDILELVGAPRSVVERASLQAS